MSGGVGQDFLKLLEQDDRFSQPEAPQKNIGEDFLRLVGDDPRLNKTPEQAFDDLEREQQDKLTEEQLDAIEAVKGKRNPALWDPRCEQYMANKSKSSGKSAVKVDSTS